MSLDVKSLKLLETKEATIIGRDSQDSDIILKATKIDGGFIYTSYNRQGVSNNVFVPDVPEDDVARLSDLGKLTPIAKSEITDLAAGRIIANAEESNRLEYYNGTVWSTINVTPL